MIKKKITKKASPKPALYDPKNDPKGARKADAFLKKANNKAKSVKKEVKSVEEKKIETKEGEGFTAEDGKALRQLRGQHFILSCPRSGMMVDGKLHIDCWMGNVFPDASFKERAKNVNPARVDWHENFDSIEDLRAFILKDWGQGKVDLKGPFDFHFVDPKTVTMEYVNAFIQDLKKQLLED